jgi:nucleotide-binding universal stress UspA family protein
MATLATPAGIALKRILVATDFSSCSEKALHHALAIARTYQSHLYLIHVVSSLGFTMAGGDTIAQAVDAAQADLRRLEKKLEESGRLAALEHTELVRDGNVWQQLEQTIEDEHIDLVVIGTHGRTGLRKIVLGSVAEEIFRHASCPVLTVGPCAPSEAPAGARLRQILYPTDMSVESAAAAHWAASLAREHGARLTVLHVFEEISGEARLDPDRVRTALESKLREWLPESAHFNSHYMIAHGLIDDMILKNAAEEPADLIIMGLRSPQTFFDHLSWLHAYRIVSEACCPVLTVRAPRGRF